MNLMCSQIKLWQGTTSILLPYTLASPLNRFRGLTLAAPSLPIRESSSSEATCKLRSNLLSPVGSQLFKSLKNARTKQSGGRLG